MNTTDSNEIARRYALLQVASSRYGKSFQDLGVQEQDEVERIALKQTELQSLILSSAEARSVVIQPELISRAIESVKARYANEHEFLQALEEHDLELSSFKDIVIRETRVETVLDKISAGVEPYSETDARIFYYLHPEKFWRPETREASHILVTINPDFPENTREQAFQRLDEIAKRLHKKPHRFAEQAQKHSECPTAMEGGRLGNVPKGVLFPSLDNALFVLKAGEVSTVLESPIGFHILWCESIHEEGLLPVDAVLPDLMAKMTERRIKKAQQEWLSQLSTEVKSNRVGLSEPG